MLEEQIKTYVTSLIRTVVPVLVGNLLGWLTLVGVPLPETVGPTLSALMILVTGAFWTIGYYALMRRLEQRWPQFGIFLGKAQAPLAYSAHPEEDKRTIGIALEATRDRYVDEEPDVDWDGPEPGGVIHSDPPMRHDGSLPRHRVRGKYRADVDPV